jgi:hypothetical protein
VPQYVSIFFEASGAWTLMLCAVQTPPSSWYLQPITSQVTPKSESPVFGSFIVLFSLRGRIRADSMRGGAAVYAVAG